MKMKTLSAQTFYIVPAMMGLQPITLWCCHLSSLPRELSAPPPGGEQGGAVPSKVGEHKGGAAEVVKLDMAIALVCVELTEAIYSRL